MDSLYNLKVIHYENGRYKVFSSDKLDSYYLVDLLYNQGNGECACPDFRINCWPMLRRTNNPQGYYIKTKKGVVINKLRTRCKHVEAARIYFLEEIINKIKNKV